MAEDSPTMVEAADSLTGLLATHVATLPDTAFPDTTIHAFRRAFIDYLACAFAGANLPVTTALRAWASAEGTRPAATVIGSDTRLSATEAALVNGAAAHGLDFDDGQTRGSVHPGGVVFSAALAEAEARGADMRAFIGGVILGYDVLVRIASAMHPVSAGLGWHNTPVAGVFGATAATARIRGLDAETTRNGLGIAASFAGGLRQYLHDGAEVKRLHPGKAARDGIVCAGLAQAGITGAIEALEGRHGLFHAMVDDRVDAEQIRSGLGTAFLIGTAYFKPYPCCRHYHAAIDGALDLRREHGLASHDVARIEVGLYTVGAQGHDHVTARNLLEAQMSAPCAMASALIRGRLSAAEFDPSAFTGAEAQRLLAATTVTVDPECEAAYPRTRSGVTRLILTDGRILERRVLDPRGEGSNPLSDDDLSTKFLDNVGQVLPPDRARDLLDLIWSADAGSDFPRLVSLLKAA